MRIAIPPDCDGAMRHGPEECGAVNAENRSRERGRGASEYPPKRVIPFSCTIKPIMLYRGWGATAVAVIAGKSTVSP